MSIIKLLKNINIINDFMMVIIFLEILPTETIYIFLKQINNDGLRLIRVDRFI